MPIVKLPDNCKGCGACCWLHAEVEPGDATPEHLTEIDPADGKRYMKRDKELWCVGLNRDDMTCMIYEQRPTCCREFERGTKPCFDALFQVNHGFMRTDRVKFERFFKRMRVPYKVWAEHTCAYFNMSRSELLPSGAAKAASFLEVAQTVYGFDDEGVFLYTINLACGTCAEAIKVEEDEEATEEETDSQPAGTDGVSEAEARGSVG